MHWKGEKGVPPYQPMPSHCVSLTPSASFNGICNQQ